MDNLTGETFTTWVNNHLPVLCIMGPTASGKTALAMQLYDILACEIVSIDSAMVYRGMNIGTGKPSAACLKRYPHHLIDLYNVEEICNVADFCNQVELLIQQIHSRGKLPLLVGGTMMYFKVLQQGLSALPSQNPALRAQLMAEAAVDGWHSLYARLEQLDLQSAQKIKPSDTQRIQRALEVNLLTGKPMHYWHAQGVKKFSFNFINLGLVPRSEDRKILHERIAQRFMQMLADGLVQEVGDLFGKMDAPERYPSFRSVGYRQVWSYIKHNCDYQTMIDISLAATRQLAKRQLTWLRSWDKIQYIPFDSVDLLADIKVFLLQEMLRSSK